MLRCLIVDDEPLAIEIIESYLNRMDNIEIVGRCTDGLKAFEILKQEQVDVVFTDIQMPGFNGLELAKQIKGTQVVLTTAYRDYALDGYELDVADYLLKPIAFDRFLTAVSKVYKNLEPKEKAVDPTVSSAAEHTFFKQDKKMVKVVFDNILYIESLKDYIKIVTTEKTVVTHENIGKIIEELPDYFLRIHRSFIVSLKKVDVYTAVTVEVNGGHELPIGKSYKLEAQERLESFVRV